MTEFFLQQFIINASDILLVVVGELTYSEQLLINKIKLYAQEQNKGRIIIIHNLKEFRTKEQVENYIENTLLKCSCFNLKKRTFIIDKKYERKNEIIDENEGNDDITPGENIKNEISYQNHFTEILRYGYDKKIEIFHLIMANENSEAGKIYNPYIYI